MTFDEYAARRLLSKYADRSIDSLTAEEWDEIRCAMNAQWEAEKSRGYEEPDLA